LTTTTLRGAERLPDELLLLVEREVLRELLCELLRLCDELLLA